MNQGQLSSQDPAYVEVQQAGAKFYVNSNKIPFEPFNPILEFIVDAEAYFDATSQTINFTLGSRKTNGVVKVVRLNKPTAINFSSSFEADPSSSAVDATKLNVISFIYFENWGGLGVGKVIYSNKLFTAI